MAYREWIRATDEVIGLQATVAWRVQDPQVGQDSRLDRVRCGLAQVVGGYLRLRLRGSRKHQPLPDQESVLRLLEAMRTVGPCLDLRDDLQAYLRRGARAHETVEAVQVAPLVLPTAEPHQEEAHGL